MTGIIIKGIADALTLEFSKRSISLTANKISELLGFFDPNLSASSSSSSSSFSGDLVAKNKKMKNDKTLSTYQVINDFMQYHHVHLKIRNAESTLKYWYNKLEQTKLENENDGKDDICDQERKEGQSQNEKEKEINNGRHRHRQQQIIDLNLYSYQAHEDATVTSNSTFTLMNTNTNTNTNTITLTSTSCATTNMTNVTNTNSKSDDLDSSANLISGMIFNSKYNNLDKNDVNPVIVNIEALHNLTNKIKRELELLQNVLLNHKKLYFHWFRTPNYQEHLDKLEILVNRDFDIIFKLLNMSINNTQ